MSNQPPPPENGLTLLKVIRQVSIPIWVRLFSLLIAVLTFVGCVWLIAIGTVFCTGDCNTKISELGVSLMSSTFVPVLALTYLAFARTGIESLRKRTDELLLFFIPSVLNQPLVSWGQEESEDIATFKIEPTRKLKPKHWYHLLWKGLFNKGYEGTPSERYQIIASWGKHTVDEIGLHLDMNMLKINVVLRIPIDPLNLADRNNPKSFIQRVFGPVLEGATHEGYRFDEHIVVTKSSLLVIARLGIGEDFIWSPSRQLHFAQDLRNFVLAFVKCWCVYRYSDKSTDEQSPR